MLSCSELLPPAALAFLAKLPPAGPVIKFPSDWDFMHHEYETSSKLLSWLFFLLNGVCVGHLVSQGWLLVRTLTERTARFLFNLGY
ncbi:MAG: hypothetical protein ACTS6G_03290 [Candidatus Hodgkinia cicadicola]